MSKIQCGSGHIYLLIYFLKDLVYLKRSAYGYCLFSHPLQSFLFKVRFRQLTVTKPWSWHNACYLAALYIYFCLVELYRISFLTLRADLKEKKILSQHEKLFRDLRGFLSILSI